MIEYPVSCIFEFMNEKSLFFSTYEFILQLFERNSYMISPILYMKQAMLVLCSTHDSKSTFCFPLEILKLIVDIGFIRPSLY